MKIQLKITGSPGKVGEQMEYRELMSMVMSIIKKRLYTSEMWALLQLSDYYYINHL